MAAYADKYQVASNDVKRFSFVLFIHHCKTVIKADQKSSLYPSINVYGTKNI